MQSADVTWCCAPSQACRRWPRNVPKRWHCFSRRTAAHHHSFAFLWWALTRMNWLHKAGLTRLPRRLQPSLRQWKESHITPPFSGMKKIGSNVFSSMPWQSAREPTLTIYAGASPARDPSSLISLWCGSSVKKSPAALQRSSSGSRTWRLSAGSITLLMARMQPASFAPYCSYSPSSVSMRSSTWKMSQTRTILSALTEVYSSRRCPLSWLCNLVLQTGLKWNLSRRQESSSSPKSASSNLGSARRWMHSGSWRPSYTLE